MGDIIRIVLLIVLAAWTIWLLYKEYEREHERQALAKKNMSFIESINLTGLPIITFHNNGHPVNMVLDTGSNVCLINKDALSNLQYTVDEKDATENTEEVFGANGGSFSGDLINLPLVYKDYNFGFECLASDMNDVVASMKQEYGVTIHGILGTGFFQKYKYILDFNSMVAYSLKKD